jgi:RNA polymerase sigma-B factor
MTATSPRTPSERALLARGRDGDRAAREVLVARYLPLARSLARRHARRPEAIEDLEQVASLALVKALERFDGERGVQFSTFAVPTIVGELRHHLRDHDRPLRVPRGLHERIAAVSRGAARLSTELGRSPTTRELAAEAGLSAEEVLEALVADVASEPVSLDAPAGQRRPGPLVETIAGAEDDLGAAERRASIAPALRALPPAERVAVHLRFELDLTQSEIAARMRLSQVHVSRLLRRALERLRVAAAPV